MTDRILAQAIVELGVPLFGENLKNKSDSTSCLFDPRRLFASPPMLEHVGKRMAEIVTESCTASSIIGMATSGIAWAALASLYASVPMLYVRKKVEENVSNKLIEGIPPQDNKLVLIDDLLFAGASKTEAIEIIQRHGHTVTDIIVVIDRQLQRKKDGPRIQDRFGVKLHSLITMSEIVEYMQETNTITPEQVKRLAQDYQKFERWDIPDFAQSAFTELAERDAGEWYASVS